MPNPSYLDELVKALKVRPGDISFIDNAYQDDRFMLDSIHTNFIGWYQETEINPQVNFIVDKCGLKIPAEVLDLACGHGRHTVQMADMGFSVVGADISPVLVEHLNTKYKKDNLKFELCSFEQYNYQNRFDLVQVLGNSLSLVPRADFLDILFRIRLSLKPGGKFFSQLDHRGYYILQEAGTRPWNFYGNRWLLFSEHDYDESQCLEKTIDTSLDLLTGDVDQFRLTKSLYTPEEIQDYLQRVGFQSVQMMGNWDGSPAKSESPMILTIAE